MVACAAGRLEVVPLNRGGIQKQEGGNGLFIQSWLSALLETCQTILDDQSLLCAVKRSFKSRHIRLEARVETGLAVVIPRLYNFEEFIYKDNGSGRQPLPLAVM